MNGLWGGSGDGSRFYKVVLGDFGKSLYNEMIHLRSVGFPPQAWEGYPFHLPPLQGLREIVFTRPVTFLVGENGSGKSTLLEGLAVAANLASAGSQEVARDPSLDGVRQFGQALRLTWQKRIHKGLFLRAEDFFGYIRRLGQMRAELEGMLQESQQATQGRSKTAQAFAQLPYRTELAAMQSQYSRDLNQFSHGEGFLEFFQARMVPAGLYLLDEPETPLSPTRQLTFLALLKQMVAQDCQFIIATHSPILLAYPQATILSFDERPLRPVAYDQLEHVTLTRLFLNDPDQFLSHL